ncbi:E3 ubiquitin-protein ligase FANCL [Acipenser ruthenus]|uniref:E3 ubiquitin-protein ligase FANCL n=1 Tax=Acipenser ruthenus TaxID=7906 RepID=A0A444UIQ7_ACIRT|nr:E3 ubiquitin-protein ligase FANCL [Acipenser ruthenus]
MHAAPPPQYYTQLIKEIESLGWDKLAYIDTEFSTIKLKAEDTSGREHLITVKLKSKSSLINIHNQFLAALESLKEFWDVMDEIDKMTWVLEPEKPTRSATMRRIAIDRDVSSSL